MWNGKNKAITFSFDDGVLQDKKLIQILDRYGLKATFNLNSGRLGTVVMRRSYLGEVELRYLEPLEIKDVYKNHEIASHTVTHPNLTALSEQTIKFQVEQDVRMLEELSGRKIKGLAYPCGGTNSNEYTAKVLKDCGCIQYARTNKMSFNFDLPKNPLLLDMSVHFAEKTKMFELAGAFLNGDFEKPVCFSIWGHAFELDEDYISWEEFEEFCKYISNKKDVFYGTNAEVYLDTKQI